MKCSMHNAMDRMNEDTLVNMRILKISRLIRFSSSRDPIEPDWFNVRRTGNVTRDNVRRIEFECDAVTKRAT